MANKTFKFRGKTVTLSFDSYRNNHSLALTIIYSDGGSDTVTVNLNSGFQSDTLAYLDTNNYPDIAGWIESNGLGCPLQVYERSGFCEYPLYEIYRPE